MIEKKIHYCWFGNNPLGEKEKRCIASWKKYCPDYEIIEWNEKNYDVTKNKYMHQSYECKKWGFVGDYARLDIIYNHGGFYFDTDVEIIKPLDDLLELKAFVGMEKDTDCINLGQGFGAVKGHEAIKALRDDYDNISFFKDGKIDLTPSPRINTNCFRKLGFEPSKEITCVSDVTVFPSEYFSPKAFENGVTQITENTYSIHRYAMSWLDEGERLLKEKEWKIIDKYGEKKAQRKIKRLRFWFLAKRKLKKIFTGKR